MKIGIDLLPLQADPKRRGISNFVYHTIRELLIQDQSNDYIFFNAKDVNLDFIRENSRTAQFVKEEISPERSQDLDLFLFTSFFDFERKFVDPSCLKCKVAIIVYDIIPVILWEYYIDFFPQKIKYEYFRRLMLIRECDKILTISDAVKKDLIDILEMPEDTIDVIYAGIDPKDKIDGDETQKFGLLKERYGLCKKYIFSVPSMDVRKNIFGLIEAYGLLPPQLSNEYLLVISNELTDEYEKKLRDYAKKCNIPEENLILTNYVSEDELVLLYKNSSLFVFPSFNEGFGLPVLEAMHYGIPVITSNISSLPEVVGGAGILINPHNSKEISQEMAHVLGDPVLQKELSETGKIQSEKFSWAITARLALTALQNYYGSGRMVRAGVVTTWNTKCGIAEYSKYLTEKISGLKITIFANHEGYPVDADGLNVIRCWDAPLDQFDALYREIVRKKIDIVHFQFNFSLFRLSSLIQLKTRLQRAGIKVIITFHGTQSVKTDSEEIRLQTYARDLRTFDKIIVHAPADQTRLADIGVTENVAVIPHGIKSSDDFTMENNEALDFHRFPVIATFGFCLPHKGLLESIQAISRLKTKYPDILFLAVSSLYPVSESQNYLDLCKKEVHNLGLNNNILFFSEFLEENKIFELLRASDMIIMPYKSTQESASGAVKFTFAALKPILVTDIPIFSEYQNEVFKISKCSPADICEGIETILQNEELKKNLVTRLEEKIILESWDTAAQKHKHLILMVTGQNTKGK